VIDTESLPTTSSRESGKPAPTNSIKEAPVSLGKLTIQFFNDGTNKVEVEGCATVGDGKLQKSFKTCFHALGEARRKARVGVKYGRQGTTGPGQY
jgi:hypothetical protein